MQNPVSKKFDTLLSKIKDKYRDKIADIIQEEDDEDIATRQLGKYEDDNRNDKDESCSFDERRRLKDNPNLVYKKITVFDKDKGVYIRNQLINPNKDKNKQDFDNGNNKDKDNNNNNDNIGKNNNNGKGGNNNNDNTDINDNNDFKDNNRKNPKKSKNINLSKIKYKDFLNKGLEDDFSIDDLKLKITEISTTKNKDEIIRELNIKNFINEKTKLYDEIIDDMQKMYVYEMGFKDVKELEDFIKNIFTKFHDEILYARDEKILSLLNKTNYDDKTKMRLLLHTLYISGLRYTIFENFDIVDIEKTKINDLKEEEFDNIVAYSGAIKYNDYYKGISHNVLIHLRDDKMLDIENAYIVALNSDVKHYADKLTLSEVSMIDIYRKFGYYTEIRLHGATNYHDGLFGAGVWAYKGYLMTGFDTYLYEDFLEELSLLEYYIQIKDRKLLDKPKSDDFTMKDYVKLLNAEFKIIDKEGLKEEISNLLGYALEAFKNKEMADEYKRVSLTKLRTMLYNILKKDKITMRDVFKLEGSYMGLIRNKKEYLFLYNIVNSG